MLRERNGKDWFNLCTGTETEKAAMARIPKHEIEMAALWLNRRRKTERGFVYFITDGHAMKIGYSGVVENRLDALQTSTTRPLTLRAKFRGTMQEERLMHDRFRHLRLQGEWFQLSPEIDQVISDLEQAQPLFDRRQTTITHILSGKKGRFGMDEEGLRAGDAFLERWLAEHGDGDKTFKTIAIRVVRTHVSDILAGKGDRERAIKAIDHAMPAFAQTDERGSCAPSDRRIAAWCRVAPLGRG